MKTVITASGNSTTSAFDLRFGRAAWFCIYDHETHEVKFVANENLENHGGAGTKTAELMAEINADRVISGDFGPKAKSLLDKLNIQMIIPEETDISVGGILDKIKQN